MSEYGTRWSGREPSWDVMLREREVTRRVERERRVSPLTAAEARAVREAIRAVLRGPGAPSAYGILRRFDQGAGAFDSRHLDLLREVERRVSERRGGRAGTRAAERAEELEPVGA
jgi:hypothetical protein